MECLFEDFTELHCDCPQTELSQNLQQLSEKAKSTTEFIQRLKNMSDAVSVSEFICWIAVLESLIYDYCD